MLAGIGVFVRIPQVMPRIADIDYFSAVIPFIRFCFYLIGIILVGGGVKKIYAYLQSADSEAPNGPS